MPLIPCRGVGFSSRELRCAHAPRRCPRSNAISHPAGQPFLHQPPLSLRPSLSLRDQELLGHSSREAQGRDSDLCRPFPTRPAAEPSFLGGCTTILTRTQDPVSRPPCKQTAGRRHMLKSSDPWLLSSPCLWPAWWAGARIFCVLFCEVKVGGVGRRG